MTILKSKLMEVLVRYLYNLAEVLSIYIGCQNHCFNDIFDKLMSGSVPNRGHYVKFLLLLAGDTRVLSKTRLTMFLQSIVNLPTSSPQKLLRLLSDGIDIETLMYEIVCCFSIALYDCFVVQTIYDHERVALNKSATHT